MRYVYDPIKKATNLKKHGLNFDDAVIVIESGESFTFEDSSLYYGEKRFITIGLLQNTLVAIVTTETTETIRIISMRKADKHEKKIFYKYHT